MATPKPRVGRLQRQVLRCFMANGMTVRTADLHEWCWFGRPIVQWQRWSTGRAAKSVGAAPVGRDGRQWLWQLGKPNS